jgi:hypothetical protein
MYVFFMLKSICFDLQIDEDSFVEKDGDTTSLTYWAVKILNTACPQQKVKIFNTACTSSTKGKNLQYNLPSTKGINPQYSLPSTKG